MGHCKVSQQNRGSYPKGKGGDGVLQQGHRGEGLRELEVQDLGCRKCWRQFFCLLWKGRSKRKRKRFDIEAYYRNKTKTFWFGPLIIRTKAELFNLFQNDLKSNRNVLALFKVQKRNQNETELISYRIEPFPYTYASEETKRTFANYFQIFFTSSERFYLLQAVQKSKQNFCIFKK